MSGLVRVGFPRALFYYEYFPFWQTFFSSLGAEIVVSSHTNQEILNSGVKAAVDETCLPVKIFHGHILNLRDKADYLFVPRLVSLVKGEYICPKFCGLPDMIRHSIRNLPPIIDVTVNQNKQMENLFFACLQAAKILRKGPEAAWKAYHQGVDAQKKYQAMLQQGYLPSELLERKRRVLNHIPKELAIAVIGHSYNVHDHFVNMNFLEKMHQRGVRVITMENLPALEINKAAAVLPKRMFWTFGRNAAGGVIHLAQKAEVDGIISLVSFACGVDSCVGEILKRRAGNIPYLILTLDEHTGQAGLDTRLEAFLDMVKWRKQAG